jgi:hypothetical protein
MIPRSEVGSWQSVIDNRSSEPLSSPRMAGFNRAEHAWRLDSALSRSLFFEVKSGADQTSAFSRLLTL